MAEIRDGLEHLHQRSKGELLDLVRRLVAEPRAYESGHSIAAELASEQQRAATRRLVAIHAQERTIRRLKASLKQALDERGELFGRFMTEAEVKATKVRWRDARIAAHKEEGRRG